MIAKLREVGWYVVFWPVIGALFLWAARVVLVDPVLDRLERIEHRLVSEH